MKFNRQKATALVLAGIMSFGLATVSLSGVSEAHRHHAQQSYEDGTSNKYSHRIHEEEMTHKQNVRALKYQKRTGDIGEKEYNRRLKDEQERHDKIIEGIKAEYEAHNPHKNR
jgi:hypothetical protein